MTRERLRLSNSQLYSVSTCGEAYRRRYVEGERVPGSLQMARGIAVHRVAQAMHRRQVEAKAGGATPMEAIGVLPTREEARDQGVAAFEAHIEAEGVSVQPDEIDASGSSGAAKGRTLDTVAAMSGFYAHRVAPKVDPLAVERKIVTQPKDASYEIVGIIDLIEDGGMSEAGREIISDLKTTTRAPKKNAINTSVQLPIYTLLRASETGVMPRETVLRHLVERPTGIEVVVQRLAPSKANLLATVARMEAAARSIRAGVFLPAEAGHWKCSLRWCEFAPTCQFFLGGAE